MCRRVLLFSNDLSSAADQVKCDQGLEFDLTYLCPAKGGVRVIEMPSYQIPRASRRSVGHGSARRSCAFPLPRTLKCHLADPLRFDSVLWLMVWIRGEGYSILRFSAAGRERTNCWAVLARWLVAILATCAVCIRHRRIRLPCVQIPCWFTRERVDRRMYVGMGTHLFLYTMAGRVLV